MGQQVVRLREARGWSRNRLAEVAGISPNGLKAIEEGESDVGLGTAYALTEALSLCSIDELLGGSIGMRLLHNLEHGRDPLAPHVVEADVEAE